MHCMPHQCYRKIVYENARPLCLRLLLASMAPWLCLLYYRHVALSQPRRISRLIKYDKMPCCGRLMAVWVEAGTGPLTFADIFFRVLPRPVFPFFPSSPPPFATIPYQPKETSIPQRLSGRKLPPWVSADDACAFAHGVFHDDGRVFGRELRGRFMLAFLLVTEGKNLFFYALSRSMKSRSVRITPMIFAGELGGCCWDGVIRRVRRKKNGNKRKHTERMKLNRTK